MLMAVISKAKILEMFKLQHWNVKMFVLPLIPALIGHGPRIKEEPVGLNKVLHLLKPQFLPLLKEFYAGYYRQLQVLFLLPQLFPLDLLATLQPLLQMVFCLCHYIIANLLKIALGRVHHSSWMAELETLMQKVSILFNHFFPYILSLKPNQI